MTLNNKSPAANRQPEHALIYVNFRSYFSRDL